MVDLKRINKIIEQEGSSPERTIHDLVREQLKQERDFKDYHLGNISETETISSPVHENIAYAEEKLTDLMNENSRLVEALAYDKASSLLETIEKLKCKAKMSWTEIIEPRTQANKSVD